MRAWLITALVLVAASVAGAQVTGEVESLGLGGYYRPDCWMPVVVTLTPRTGKTDNYLLRIRQEDMDRDHPVFARVVSVTGASADHPATQQHFRTYIKASPINGGLIEPGEPTGDANLTTAQVLAKQLPVELWSTAMKLITPLPLTSGVQTVDGKPTGFDARMGRRMVLVVAGSEEPPHNEYDIATGLMEQVLFVPVRPSDLPESATGYDCVDAVLWLDADPAALHEGGDEKFRALEQFVRGGGHLVICQSPEWQRTLGMGELLPVTLSGTRTRADTAPLGSIAIRGLRSSVLVMPDQKGDEGDATAAEAGTNRMGATQFRMRGRAPEARATPRADEDAIRQWESARGPFTLGIAQPKPGSYVQTWINWPDGQATPYICRKATGAGAVTWVAQDLGSAELASAGAGLSGGSAALRGWPFIYQTVFDWKDVTRLVAKAGPGDLALDRDYGPSADCDEFGYALLGGMELPGRSAALIGVAFAFFIGYWIVAGPGGFGFLVVRQRTEQSWFVFGATALAGTLVTIVVVKLMLGGAPELRHVSVVRIAPGEPATVYSRFGLYIPRDGQQRLELAQPAAGWSAAMSSFAIHPLLKPEFPDDNGPDYDVPVADEAADGPVVLNVPYRSTLKRFEASWAGDLPQHIEGSPVLSPGALTPVTGVLTNRTGRKLTDVFIAVKGLPREDPDVLPVDDHLLYLPSWDADKAIDLAQQFRVKFATDDTGPGNPLVGVDAAPGGASGVVGRIQQDWQPYWMHLMPNRALGGDTRVTDPLLAAPMLSLFGRIAPMQSDTVTGVRYELRRLGARRLDVSPAVGAGAVVIVASAQDDPLPLPLDVDGQPVAGSGWTIYQFVLPADTDAACKATTRPVAAMSSAVIP